MAASLPTNNQTQPQSAMGNAYTAATQQSGNNNAPQNQPSGTMGYSTAPQSQMSFLNFGMGSPMPLTQTSEALNKLMTAIKKVFLEYEATSQYNIRFHPMDKDQFRNLPLSVLVISASSKTNSNLGVSYFVLIVEGSTDPLNLQPRMESFGAGQQVEVLRVAGDADTFEFQELIKAHLRNELGTGIKFVSGTGWCNVIPRDFKYEDEPMVFTLTANSVFAATLPLQQADPAFQDLNLGTIARDARPTVNTTFGQQQVFDINGGPVRSDIVVQLLATPNQSINTGLQRDVDKSVLLTTARGFMDIDWRPALETNTYMMQGGIVDPRTYKKYTARLVLTAMEAVRAPTMGCQLLAMLSAAYLRENSMWMFAFKPRIGGDTTSELHDIGAVNIEANLANEPGQYGKKISTTTNKFVAERDLPMLVNSCFQMMMSLSLDIPEAGPSTFVNAVWREAARGDQKATKKIIDGANQLTNNNFSKYWQGSEVCNDENNRIHLGYYIDQNGVKQDLRHIDYLAVLNLIGEKSPELAREWSSTFTFTAQDIKIRLAARYRIMCLLFSKVVVQGYGIRATINASFMEALAKGVHDCGISINANTPFNDSGMQVRSSSPYVQYAAMGPESFQIFNRNTNQQYGQQTGQANIASSRF